VDEQADLRVEDDAAPVSAAESLRMIENQRAAAQRSLAPDPRLIYWPWGLAWLIGFSLLFLRHGPGERVRWDMPSWLPVTVLYVLMVAAFVVSGIAGSRARRQVSGDSSTKGLMYGMSWFLGFASMGVTLSHFSDMLPFEQQGLLWAASSIGLVGVLYMAGAAIWKAPEMFVLGAWVTVSNIGGVIAGPGWHSLVAALAGGGGLIVAGFVQYCGPGRVRLGYDRHGHDS
jgi:hypothetical protein